MEYGKDHHRNEKSIVATTDQSPRPERRRTTKKTCKVPSVSPPLTMAVGILVVLATVVGINISALMTLIEELDSLKVDKPPIVAKGDHT